MSLTQVKITKLIQIMDILIDGHNPWTRDEDEQAPCSVLSAKFVTEKEIKLHNLRILVDRSVRRGNGDFIDVTAEGFVKIQVNTSQAKQIFMKKLYISHRLPIDILIADDIIEYTEYFHPKVSELYNQFDKLCTNVIRKPGTTIIKTYPFDSSRIKIENGRLEYDSIFNSAHHVTLIEGYKSAIEAKRDLFRPNRSKQGPCLFLFAYN